MVNNYIPYWKNIKYLDVMQQGKWRCFKIHLYLLVRILFPQFEVLVEKNPETPRNF